MAVLVFYYLVLPFLIFWALLLFMRKAGPDSAPAEIREIYARDPVEPGSFRAARLDGRFGRPPAELTKLGDFESQQEAVDAAFAAKFSAPQGAGASFLVLNDKGEILQEV